MLGPVPLRCRVCGANWRVTRTLGPLPPDPFDGMLVEFAELRNRGLRLHQCGACQSLLCDDERADEERLKRAYRSLDGSYWENLNPYRDFSRSLLRHVRDLPVAPEVWDVGCGTGRLLEQLPKEWRCHGVEPGASAAAHAQARGLDVRCGTLESLALDGVADLVLMIDTLEHLLDPEEVLQRVRAMLRPGGRVLVFTGAADRAVPRTTASTWYYLRCVGHVTVASRTGLKRLLERTGFEVRSQVAMQHPGGVRAGKYLSRFAGNAVRRLLARELAPTPMFHDHQLIGARRVESRA